MTFDKWWATLETREQRRADKEFTREAFEAGAASRDAEIVEVVRRSEEAMRNEPHMNYLRRKTADEAELWAADRIEQLELERDAAFAMSRCECEANECCANLVKLHDRIAELEAERDELKAALKEVKGLSAATATPIIDATIAKTQPLLGTHCEAFSKGQIFQDAEGTIPVTESGQPVGAIRDDNGEIAMRCYGATLCTDEDHRPVIQIGEKND